MTALVAGVWAVAGVSAPEGSSGAWCVHAIQGQATRVNAGGGLPNYWEGDSLSRHYASPVSPLQEKEVTNLYGEGASNGAVWLVASGSAEGYFPIDTVPFADGHWPMPGCIFVVESDSLTAAQVEAVWDGFVFGFAS